MNVFKIQRYEFFCQRWNEIPDVVDYDTAWEKPIDPNTLISKIVYASGEVGKPPLLIPYSLDGIHLDESLNKLPVGSIVKSMDDYGRKVIIVVTRLGLITMHMVSLDPKGIEVAANASDRLKWSAILPKLVQARDVAEILGSPKSVLGNTSCLRLNFGQSLELTIKVLTDPNYKPGNNVRRIRKQK